MNKNRKGILEKIASISTEFMQKYLPDAYIFAAMLTFIVFIATLIMTGQSFTRVVGHWGGGIWSLLSFSMQMVLVLVTGHVLALAPPFSEDFE